MRIKKIVFKYDFGFLIDENNNIYGIGNNEYGQLGFYSRMDFLKKMVKLKDQFNDIKIGRGFTYALKKNGYFNKWYCSGYDEYNQLGIVDNNYNCIQQWTYSDIKDIFVNIECGFNHCLALTKENELYCWGDNQHFQLTKYEERSVSSPKKTNYKFRKIFAFADCNFAFDESDQLYFWGSNKNGLSGVPCFSEEHSIHEPLPIFRNDKILHLSFSDTHVIIKTFCEKYGTNYWQYGSNKNGQLLDLSNSSMDVLISKSLTENFKEDNKTMKNIIQCSHIGEDRGNKIKKFWCGNDFTIIQNEDYHCHLIAIDKKQNEMELLNSLFVRDFVLHEKIYFPIQMNNNTSHGIKIINEEHENLFKHHLWVELKRELLVTDLTFYFDFDLNFDVDFNGNSDRNMNMDMSSD
jgi:alpha-tubulin suppressor-like RCC1 family protein